MENFVVSARKYRPSTFDTVVGQKSITTTLKNAIRSQQLAQAFLFCGPRGVGKTTCARILAKTINCRQLTENFEPCNQCESCRSFNELTSFNVHELDAASNNSVEDIRALVDQVRIPPQAGRYKVYIIDEVHMLSASAFNAFLKTLEEPPAYAKFILATTEKHKILPTILSRCQIFDFRRITVDDIAQHLAFVAASENISFEPDALHLIAQKADGALRDALSIFDQIAISSGNNITFQAVLDNLNILDYDYYFRMTGIILEKNVQEALLLIDKVIENGFEGHIFLAGFASHLRNLLVCKDESTLALLEAGENITMKYRDFARKCSESFLIRTLEITNKFDFEYKTSNNKRLHLELAFILMCGRHNEGGMSAGENPEKKKSESRIDAVPEKTTPIESQSLQPTPPPKKQAVIGDKIVRLQDEEQKQESTGAAEPVFEYGEDVFGEEQMIEAWMKTAEAFRQQSGFYTCLVCRKPSRSEGFRYVFTVDNNLLMNEFAQKKGAILHSLKSLLNNKNIEIDEKLAEAEESDKVPYTAEARLNRMVEKNPHLKDLKEQLDLELEY